MTRSIPIAKAYDDAMIAYGQNGEALRPEQGYPARLLNPGWEGNSNVKWLRRIELSDRPFMTREETSKYTEPIGDGKSRQFSFVMDARSLITYPGYPRTLEPGWIEIRGIAWSGRGRIARVEISLDDRDTWVEADLQEPILSKAHTRFRYLWNWDGRETAIWSRAIDETGLRAAESGRVDRGPHDRLGTVPSEPHHRLAHPSGRLGDLPPAGVEGMTAPWRVPLPALIGAAAVACGPGAPADGTPSSGLARHVALEARAASGALSAPFGFGRPARADELRAQDIDVGPDGRGLPAGSGTVAEGRALYAARCAVCHGANGEGGPNDRLVGTEPVGPDGFPRTIGNYWPYAPTLFDYTRRAMPLDAPGSLTDDQVYGLVAVSAQRQRYRRGRRHHGRSDPVPPRDACSRPVRPRRPTGVPSREVVRSRTRISLTAPPGA